MMKATGRIFKGGSDLEKMIRLTRQNRSPLHQIDYPSPQDLEEMISDPQVLANIRLWDDPTGSLAAYALVDAYFNLCWEIQKGAAIDQLGDQIIEWGAECARIMGSRTREKPRIEASCRAEDRERVEFLSQHGFQLQPDQTLHLVLDLTGVLPSPVLPPGFVIRPVKGFEEADGLAALHRSAFGTEYMTPERRLAMMRTSTYDPTLDFVALAPDGQLAGYCMGSIDSEVNSQMGVKVGSADPVAVAPEFQRKGLAKALLLTVAAALQQRGMRYARSGTSSENLRMKAAAKSAGFKIESTMLWFQKNVK
jgi:mycothiol synthase